MASPPLPSKSLLTAHSFRTHNLVGWGGGGGGHNIRNSRQRPSEHCGMHLCFSAPVQPPFPTHTPHTHTTTTTPSDGGAVLNFKMSGAYWLRGFLQVCRDDSTYTYSCQVYVKGAENGGSPRCPLRHTDSHHHHHHHRVSSANGIEK